MALNPATTYLKFVNLQMAAEGATGSGLATREPRGHKGATGSGLAM